MISSQKVFKLLSSIFVCMAVLWTTACAKKDSEQELSRTEQARLHIQNQEYQEAEKLLLDEKVEKNGDVEKTLLASIYVHQAGISISHYFKFEQIFKDDGEEQQVELGLPTQLLGLESSKNPYLKILLDFFKGVDQILRSTRTLSNKIQSIPKVSQSEYQNLQKAESVLGDLESPTKGQFLFRGIVRLVMFRYMLENGMFFEGSDQDLCASKLIEFQNSVVSFKSYISKMLDDVAGGLPKDASKIAEISKQINQDLGQVESVITKFWTLNSSLQDSINTVADKAGLDVGEIECRF